MNTANQQAHCRSGCDGQWGLQARFWDGNSLEQRKSFSKDWKVESVSFCPDRSRFVVGGEDMYAHLYDYETGNELECNRGMLAPCLSVAPGNGH